MMEWKPIETAPWRKWILCWWTPVNDNPYAETVVKAQVVSPPDLYAEGAKPLTYWDGHEEFPIERLTHWMPLPEPPSAKKQSIGQAALRMMVKP